MSENDLVFKHEYDGIKEYDNPLPGWWLFLFWATILFSAWYLLYYQFGHGETVPQQYDREMLALYDLQTKQLLKLGPINDELIVGFTAKPDMMASAKGLYAQKCAVCHGPAGQGNIGPNLTDDFWIHGGGPMQVHKTIHDGVPEKGMPAWGQVLKPEELPAVTAYVLSLYGSNPVNAKEPQGERIAR